MSLIRLKRLRASRVHRDLHSSGVCAVCVRRFSSQLRQVHPDRQASDTTSRNTAHRSRKSFRGGSQPTNAADFTAEPTSYHGEKDPISGRHLGTSDPQSSSDTMISATIGRSGIPVMESESSSLTLDSSSGLNPNIPLSVTSLRSGLPTLPPQTYTSGDWKPRTATLERQVCGIPDMLLAKIQGVSGCKVTQTPVKVPMNESHGGGTSEYRRGTVAGRALVGGDAASPNSMEYRTVYTVEFTGDSAAVNSAMTQYMQCVQNSVVVNVPCEIPEDILEKVSADCQCLVALMPHNRPEWVPSPSTSSMDGSRRRSLVTDSDVSRRQLRLFPVPPSIPDFRSADVSGVAGLNSNQHNHNGSVMPSSDLPPQTEGSSLNERGSLMAGGSPSISSSSLTNSFEQTGRMLHSVQLQLRRNIDYITIPKIFTRSQRTLGFVKSCLHHSRVEVEWLTAGGVAWLDPSVSRRMSETTTVGSGLDEPLRVWYYQNRQNVDIDSSHHHRSSSIMSNETDNVGEMLDHFFNRLMVSEKLIREVSMNEYELGLLSAEKGRILQYIVKNCANEYEIAAMKFDSTTDYGGGFVLLPFITDFQKLFTLANDSHRRRKRKTGNQTYNNNNNNNDDSNPMLLEDELKSKIQQYLDRLDRAQLFVKRALSNIETVDGLSVNLNGDGRSQVARMAQLKTVEEMKDLMKKHNLIYHVKLPGDKPDRLEDERNANTHDRGHRSHRESGYISFYVSNPALRDVVKKNLMNISKRSGMIPGLTDEVNNNDDTRSSKTRFSRSIRFTDDDGRFESRTIQVTDPNMRIMLANLIRKRWMNDNNNNNNDSDDGSSSSMTKNSDEKQDEIPKLETFEKNTEMTGEVMAEKDKKRSDKGKIDWSILQFGSDVNSGEFTIYFNKLALKTEEERKQANELLNYAQNFSIAVLKKIRKIRVSSPIAHWLISNQSILDQITDKKGMNDNSNKVVIKDSTNAEYLSKLTNCEIIVSKEAKAWPSSLEHGVHPYIDASLHLSQVYKSQKSKREQINVYAFGHEPLSLFGLQSLLSGLYVWEIHTNLSPNLLFPERERKRLREKYGVFDMFSLSLEGSVMTSPIHRRVEIVDSVSEHSDDNPKMIIHYPRLLMNNNNNNQMKKEITTNNLQSYCVITSDVSKQPRKLRTQIQRRTLEKHQNRVMKRIENNDDAKKGTNNIDNENNDGETAAALREHRISLEMENATRDYILGSAKRRLFSSDGRSDRLMSLVDISPFSVILKESDHWKQWQKKHPDLCLLTRSQCLAINHDTIKDNVNDDEMAASLDEDKLAQLAANVCQLFENDTFVAEISSRRMRSIAQMKSTRNLMFEMHLRYLRDSEVNLRESGKRTQQRRRGEGGRGRGRGVGGGPGPGLFTRAKGCFDWQMMGNEHKLYIYQRSLFESVDSHKKSRYDGSDDSERITTEDDSRDVRVLEVVDSAFQRLCDPNVTVVMDIDVMLSSLLPLSMDDDSHRDQLRSDWDKEKKQRLMSAILGSATLRRNQNVHCTVDLVHNNTVSLSVIDFKNQRTFPPDNKVLWYVIEEITQGLQISPDAPGLILSDEKEDSLSDHNGNDGTIQFVRYSDQRKAEKLARKQPKSAVVESD